MYKSKHVKVQGSSGTKKDVRKFLGPIKDKKTEPDDKQNKMPADKKTGSKKGKKYNTRLEGQKI